MHKKMQKSSSWETCTTTKPTLNQNPQKHKTKYENHGKRFKKWKNKKNEKNKNGI